jgi:TolB protein
MGQKKMKIKNINLMMTLLVPLALSCFEKQGEAPFNYGKIIRNEYKFRVGKVVPVTIEQSTEIDGDFSSDGKYFFFSSDRDRGNYDIYLRSLSGITTVRITKHPSKDTSPAISPNGKYLAFVSQREDPEGDIYVVRIKSDKILKDAEGTASDIPTLDEKALNVTQYQDPVTKTIKIIKDATPAWSPDGEQIAFSSNRDGMENIWVMDRKGGNMRQITKKGGMYPRFSPDGKLIVYISYRDKGNSGELYTVDVSTLSEKKITDNSYIKLYPSFLGSSSEIIYTRIDRDTNGDGKTDLKDNSVIRYLNMKTGADYPMTLYSQSSFAPKWTSSLKATNDQYENVILYCSQVGQNININMIPEYGLIPKRASAHLQYELASRYLKEYDDMERYLFALERVHHFFGDKKDTESIAIVSRALIDAAKLFNWSGSKSNSSRIQAVLASLSKDRDDLRNIASRYLDNILAGKPGDDILEKRRNSSRISWTYSGMNTSGRARPIPGYKLTAKS